MEGFGFQLLTFFIKDFFICINPYISEVTNGGRTTHFHSIIPAKIGDFMIQVQNMKKMLATNIASVSFIFKEIQCNPTSFH